MPLKAFWIIFFSVTLLSCSVEGNKESKFDNLSETQKDSVAQYYHNFSNYFLQPSDMYRKLKDSALMIVPDNVEYRQKLSYSYKKRGEHIKAMEQLNQAVDFDIKQNSTDALGYRAWSLLYYYRDYEGAINDINKIEAMTGMTYNICWGEPCGFQKGQALYRLKKYEEAIKAFDKVNEEEEKRGFDTKDNIYILFYKGRCLEELGRLKEAMKCYQNAIGSYNTFPEAYYRIGKIFAKKDNEKGARANYYKAKELLNYKIQEPFIERFDEVFPYMIDEAIMYLE